MIHVLGEMSLTKSGVLQDAVHRIFEIRQMHGYSREVFSILIDIPPAQYIQEESGEAPITLETVTQIYLKFGVSVDYLLFGLEDQLTVNVSRSISKFRIYKKSLIDQPEPISTDELIKMADKSGVPIDLIIVLSKGMSPESTRILARNLESLPVELKESAFNCESYFKN